MNYHNAIPSSNDKSPGGIDAFGTVPNAPEYEPLPPGIYTGRVQRGEYTSTRAGAEAYRIRFEVTEGPEAGKTIVRTWTFGAKALPYTQRDLAPFGLTNSAQLLSPFPEAGREYLVRLVVALQRGDDGIARNDVKRIEVVRVGEPPAAEFKLPPPAPTPTPPASTRESEGGKPPSSLFGNDRPGQLPD